MNCMEKIGNFIGKCRDLYSQINQLTLSGACDVIVVRNSDTGQLKSTPFYVRFGFLDLAVPKRHRVNINVNGNATDIQMYVGDYGFAYFSDDQKLAEQNLDIPEQEISDTGDNKACIALGQGLSESQAIQEESLIKELESVIEIDSIDPNNFEQKQSSTNASPKKEEDKNSHFQRINNWVKKRHRQVVNTETSLSMNFDLNNFDEEMIAINSDNNCTRTPDGYLKTLYMTSEQLESMSLKYGLNEIQFKLASAFQGTRNIKANIFLWNSHDKVVISDFDGTVTKSNMLGHFLPLFGKQWHQQYVSKLFEKIEDNGYKIVYITMRPTGYSNLTKKQLTSIKINNTHLPNGPLVLCPLTFFNSISVEVVFKAADIMKTELIKSIVSLFSKDTNPLHAGFGNTKSDMDCYNQLGISSSHNFKINTKGQVVTAKLKECSYSCSEKTKCSNDHYLTYKKILDDIDTFFPPVELAL